MYQYFYIYSFPTLYNFYFWIAWALTLCFNILDVSGLLSDILFAVKHQYTSSRSHHNDGSIIIGSAFPWLNKRFRIETKKDMFQMPDLKERRRLGEPSVDEMLNSEEIMGFTAVQQKSVVLFLVSWLGILLIVLDTNIVSLFQGVSDAGQVASSNITCTLFCLVGDKDSAVCFT
jgi:hypothetical protein